MKVDKVRLERQKQGLKLWKENGYKGLLMYPTGTGKTFCAILAIKHLRMQDPHCFVIVVVPTDNLRTQWKQKLQEFGITSVYVETVHSLVGKSHECDLLILDEIHSYTGGKVFSTVFDCVKRKYTLGLTAKERDDEQDKAVIEENCPVVDIMSLKEALHYGFISEFKVYNLGLEFNQKDRIEYEKLNRQFYKYFSTFNFDFNLAMRANRDSALVRDISRNIGLEEKVVKVHAFQFGRAMRLRKQYLYKADILVETAKQIVQAFPDKKIITFSEDNATVDLLTEVIPNSIAYHSSLETIIIDGKKYGAKRRREMALKGFKEGKYQRLHCARALNMGQDIPDIDMSIKISFNSTVIDAIQRLGRTLRKNGEKQAVEINLYLKDTQSERWLRKSQAEIPNVHWINSISEIV